jgi:tungstate transport system ATP-binding protein
MGAGALLKVDSLYKNFGGIQAVTDLSFELAQGELLGLIGPNGSGKTTLVRILAGLERQDAGDVAYIKDGSRLATGPTLMRMMTLAGQRPTLFRMSLRKNIEYGLRARGIPKDYVRARAGQALASAGLAHLASASGLTLSGGEAQRAALVRACALMPEALFLDEPTASLDPENTVLAERLISSLNRDHGTTVVIVTHNLFQAKRLADRVYFVMGGRLIEQGPAVDMFTRPSDPLTAKYVSGEMVY